MRFTLRILVAVSLLVTFITSPAFGQGSCADVLGSVYDRTSRTRYYVASHSFQNFFCSRTFSNAAEARDAGAQVGIPIDGLPLQLGVHSREENWSAYQQELCHIVTSNEAVDETTFVQLERVNARVIEAWERCVTSNAPGLYFYAEVDDLARTVSFMSRFQGLDNTQQFAQLRRRQSLVLTPINLLECSTTFPAQIGRNPETVTCERGEGADGALTAVLRTQTLGSPRVSVPPAHRPRTEMPPPFCTAPVLLSRDARADASSQSDSASAVTNGNISPGNWNALAPAEQWVRVFLPQPSTITHVQLNPEQTPSGRTTNIISMFRRAADGTEEEVIVDTLNQDTISGGIVTSVIRGQMRNVTAVRVRTVMSPSFVSWREIEIFGCPQ